MVGQKYFSKTLIFCQLKLFVQIDLPPLPSSLSSQKRISKIQNRVLGHTDKEKGQRKGQVFSNWHLFKTIHQFKYLNHAEEKATLFFPLSYKCSDIVLSLPPTSLPPSCLLSFSSYVFLSLFNFLCLFSSPIRNF